MKFIRKFAFVPVVAATVALAACNTTGGTKQTVGTVLGGVGGAVIGAQFGKGTGQLVGVGLGTLAGAWLGSEIGASLDKADQAAAGNAQQAAYRAPIGEQIQWNNPDSGNYGTVTPVRDGRTASGSYCREFQHKVYVGGKLQNAYGTACQQPNGDWQIVQ